MSAPARPATPLSPAERERYSRHVILPEVGLEGQRRLKQASVLLVGAGGLGAPLGLYLAAAGVGRIGLVDFDVVDASNLQRQVIYGTSDIGKRKLDAAVARLADINPHIAIEPHETRLVSANALNICGGYDMVIVGTDNFATRYLVNDVCVLLGKPNVHGSIFRFEGQVSVFWAERGPCYRCLFPEPPPPGLVPSCAEGGVLGILPGTVGTLQATEAIKLILGFGEPLIGRLLLYDALAMRFRELKLEKDPGCAVCGKNPTLRELIDYEQFCGVASAPDAGAEIASEELRRRLASPDPPFVLDVRNREEWEMCRIDGAVLIPLPELQARMSELPRDADLVVHCRLGQRSARAVAELRAAGFARARSLKGGIEAWLAGR